MAVPRVFISSTCYDLSEVRDRLIPFFNAFGFETVLSEKGDVFYHPDLHTHEACLGEVSNCQLFVLIIGGRFGGKYKINPEKSITNAEFLAAKELKIPIFTFIKEGVLADHNVYQKNKDSDFAEKIAYPSIEHPEHAPKVFKFIDEVRLAETNNGFFGFGLSKDIEGYLRKQLAAMFFDFLVQKNFSNRLDRTDAAVSKLNSATEKIEELVKVIYRRVDSEKAEIVIQAIENESNASAFFKLISIEIEENYFISQQQIEKISESNFDNWWDFLEDIGPFEYISGATTHDDQHFDFILYIPTERMVCTVSGFFANEERDLFNKLTLAYRAYLALHRVQRMNVLSRFAQDEELLFL